MLSITRMITYSSMITYTRSIINHHSCFITSVIILALGLDRPIKDLRIKEKKQIKNDLSGKDIEGRQKLLTLYLLRVTQREFLLTISIQYQA